MGKRYVSIWFPYLKTDWFTIRNPDLKDRPFALRAVTRGRMVITAVNAKAEKLGIISGTTVGDGRAAVKSLSVLDDKADLADVLLKRVAEWCIRFTPVVAVDWPDGIILDATGCSQLWGGDDPYLADMEQKLSGKGYLVKVAIADTIGAAWAVARFEKYKGVIPEGQHVEALLSLPPQSLRIEPEVVQKLHKLGLNQIKNLIKIPRSSLRKRFGPGFISQLDRALGQEIETLSPIVPIEPYQERLPCLEPIVTAVGTEIALKRLLETICLRLRNEQKGIRKAVFKGYRIDGKTEQISIGTHHPTYNSKHLFKLFETKLSTISPALGIELFTLDVTTVDDCYSEQEKMWEDSGTLNDERIFELIDRLSNRLGNTRIHRYLPAEHYWPERSFKKAASLDEVSVASWRTDKLRPLQILTIPERIEVTSPIPDYPPMLFVHNSKQHRIVRADGPERIEQEWWIQQGQHRDYYSVEDSEGYRYWLFRSGHYDCKNYQWFLHGFFA